MITISKKLSRKSTPNSNHYHSQEPNTNLLKPCTVVLDDVMKQKQVESITAFTNIVPCRVELRDLFKPKIGRLNSSSGLGDGRSSGIFKCNISEP